MKTRICLIFLSLILLVACNFKETPTKPSLAKVDPVDDVYFGIKITDPYRYMENLQDSAVTEWLKQQSDYTRSILNSIPGRQKLIDKMLEFDKRKSTSVSSLYITDNDRYFYLKTTPDDETGKLFYRDGFEGKEILLFDPEKFGSDTTQKYVISTFVPSLDGLKVGFEVAPNGSESSILLIMDVDNMKLFDEQIDRCWGSISSWLPDNESFLYNRLQSSDVHDINREQDSKTYIHSVGSDPAQDREIFSRTNNPELNIKPEEIPILFYDKDSKYLFGIIATVDNRLNAYYASLSDLKKDKIAWKRLFKPSDEVYNFNTTNSELYIYTPKNAPNFRILKTSLTNPNLSTAIVVVPEDSQRKLTNFSLNSEGLFYSLSENGVKERLFFVTHEGKNGKEIDLPFDAGSVNIKTKGYEFTDMWINISGWSNNNQRYRYLAERNEFKLENLSTIPEYPEYNDLMVEELMVASHDGVNVPLSLIYKKGINKDGNNPVLFYGYGAYGISMNPFFSPPLLLWTNDGGILAIPHVRGGGELGDQWYRGGFKTTKPNTWKDLIACAEYLSREGYTSPQKIAINSGSAGGVLIGRAMTERPDLFAVAIPEVGCLNTLRGEESPNGPVNVPEFGTVKDSVECMALMEMDSYLHLRENTNYPATLITAGMNDPRVIAWQPAKFAARLQAVNKSEKPVLLLVDYEAGHGIGNTKTKDFESLADILSFAFWQIGHPNYQIK